MAKKPDPQLEDWEIIAEGVSPDAAIKFWQERAKLTWDEAKELAAGARARAFYVTGLARQDLVDLVSSALEEALKNGTTLEDFKKGIEEAIKAKGWKDYRIETIFRTNMQTAYSAGRYLKMQSVKKTRPYWQYMAVMDKRTRPSHAILNGVVYPADHEFWNSNYPPNGFRCRCGVITLSERQVSEQGLTVEKEMPKPGVWTDPKTGIEYFVHFPGADKGFRDNPFREWAKNGGIDNLPGLNGFRDALEKLPRNRAIQVVQSNLDKYFAGWRKNPHGNMPLCVIKKTDAELIGANMTIASLSAETMGKQDAKHGELTDADYRLAQEAVDNGERIQHDAKNLCYILNRPGGIVVIVKATITGNGLFVTSIRKLSGKDGKREEEIQRLKEWKKKG